jgi:hypothetical protein
MVRVLMAPSHLSVPGSSPGAVSEGREALLHRRNGNVPMQR